jgi:outer membrane protein assembly factor BamA
MTGLPIGQLEAILLHELAHVRRHDYVINFLQILIETLFFYHPCVWWLSRQIRIERENCCDDVALAVLGDRVDYARALLAVEELRAAPSLLALGAQGGSLSARLRRLYFREPDRSAVGPAGALSYGLLAAVVLALVGGPAGLWSASVVADGRESSLPKNNASVAPKVPAQENFESGVFIDVLVEGNATLRTAGVLQKVKTRPGRATTIENVREDVHALVKTRWFLTVDTRYRRTEKGLVLVFIVLERPIVRSVEYKGNTDIKSSKLAAQSGLKVGSPYEVSFNREAAKRLESFYHEKDYTEATVELEKGNSRDDRDVIFRIHEGPKQKIAWREFEGNKAVSGELLTKQLESTPAYGLLVGGEFDHAKQQEDIAKVRKYYENLGYFDAKVEPQVFYSKNRKWISLHYKIQEGAQYKIGKYSVSGITGLTTEDFHQEFQKLTDKSFNSRLVDEVSVSIGDKAKSCGYSYFRIKPVLMIQSGPRRVDIDFHMQRHPPRKLQGARIFNGETLLSPNPASDPGK